MSARITIRRGQHWQFTTAAGEIREYVVEHIADHVEMPGRRVRLRRLGGGMDSESFASVYEGWLYEGSRPTSDGRWELLGEAVSA